MHRIGRTARAFRKGAAYTFAEAYQLAYVQAYIRRTGVQIYPLELQYDFAASYTLPKDGSNKRDAEARARDREHSVRYFLNVGKRDMFDKPSLVRFVCSVAGVNEYKIIDVKIRDTYSFVQVTDDEADKVLRLKGKTVGTRVVNVDIASDEAEEKEKKQKKDTRKKTEASKIEGRRVGRDAASKARATRHSKPDGKAVKSKDKPQSKKGKVLNRKGEIQNPKPRRKRTKKL